MNILKAFLETLKNGCVYFTVLILSMSVVAVFMPKSTITTSTMFGLFFLCIVIAFANVIFKIPKIAFFLRIILHYIVMVLSFYFIFTVCLKLFKTQSMILLSLVFFTVIYALIITIYSIVRGLKNKSKNKSKVYSSRFENNSDSQKSDNKTGGKKCK